MPRDIDREELQRMVGAGAQLVEVLPPEEYQDDHLPGAISIPLSRINRETTAMLDKNRPLIVYCWDTA